MGIVAFSPVCNVPRVIIVHPVGVAAFLEPGVAARADLDAAGAIMARTLVAGQGGGHCGAAVARRLGQATRQHHAVLDRHAGAEARRSAGTTAR